MRIHYQADGQTAPRHGLILLQALIVGLFCVFALRLWYLQIHKGAYYAEKARDNRLRQESMYAPRGLVRDRQNRIVAVNEPAYALAVIREDVRDMDAALRHVGKLTGIPKADLEKKLKKDRRKVKRFEPLVLVNNIPFDLVSQIESNTFRWPGLEIVVRPKRYYPQGELLAHILGYVAEANEEELEKDADLALGDTVGKRGLEFTLEHRMRGQKGLRQIEVDASGRRMHELVVKDPRAGEHINLSIDLDLQRVATDALKKYGREGSVVVMEPFSGQILAMASIPSFDNNAFVTGLSGKEWAKLRDDPRHVLLNRAYQSAYPPGSVFKLVMAATGLHENMLDPEKTVFCPGHMRLGNRIFRCWKKWGHGHVNLRRGLVESCDVYFYDLGKRLGVDRIAPFAKQCGLGTATGIDLPHEKSGLIPTREWKRRTRGQRWQGGENLNLAIGQGYTLATPLQIARFIGALVNGGIIRKPLLVSTDRPVEVSRMELSEDNLALILETMKETVDSPRGTCRRLRTKDAAIGGKTGTAQVVRLTEEARGAKTEDIRYKFRDHSWLASWGVMDGRAVVIVSMVEHGGHGSESSIPVAKTLYNYLFANPDGFPVDHWPHRMKNSTLWNMVLNYDKDAKGK
jgi:penicillin-binding protein 2